MAYRFKPDELARRGVTAWGPFVKTIIAEHRRLLCRHQPDAVTITDPLAATNLSICSDINHFKLDETRPWHALAPRTDLRNVLSVSSKKSLRLPVCIHCVNAARFLMHGWQQVLAKTETPTLGFWKIERTMARQGRENRPVSMSKAQCAFR